MIRNWNKVTSNITINMSLVILLCAFARSISKVLILIPFPSFYCKNLKTIVASGELIVID